VVLRCDPERAFTLFTEHAGEWWPADRRHTRDATSTIRIEASGRFFERASDGTEVELGVVRAYEPPNRLVVDWYPGTDPQHPTHVEVSFISTENGTRVTITHGAGAAGDDGYSRNVHKYGSSWDMVLAALAEYA
jgi:uncharacterized protein YndB with AHSA1/START domain